MTSGFAAGAVHGAAGSRPFWLAATTLAIAFGLGLAVGPLGYLGVIVPGLLLYAALVAFMLRAGRRRPVAIDRVVGRYLPWMWMLLFLVSNQRFFVRDPLALASAQDTGYSIDNIIEVGVYGIIGLVATRLWGSGRGSTYLDMAILFIPVWALVTAPRSAIVALSAVRAMELFVPLLLVWVTARAATTAKLRMLLIGRIATTLPRITMMLALWALLAGDYLDGRFTWPGAHPGLSANLFALTLILAFFVPQRLTSRIPGERLATIVAMVFALFFNHTRSADAGVLLGLVLGSLACDRAMRRFRVAITLSLVAVAAALWALRQDLIVKYVARGEAVHGLGQFDGRVPVWSYAISHLHGWADWVLGIGYASIRVVIYPEFSWAGSGHSAWVELLVDLGVPAVAAMVVSLLVLIFRLMASVGSGGVPLRGLVVANLVFLIVVSFVSEAFAIPGFLFALLVLTGWMATEVPAPELPTDAAMAIPQPRPARNRDAGLARATVGASR